MKLLKEFGEFSMEIFHLSSEGLSHRLLMYSHLEDSSDGHIFHIPLQEKEKNYVSYVGNGFVGLTNNPDSYIYIKNGRSLSLPVHFRPVTLLSIKDWSLGEAVITQYRSGISTRLQYWHLEESTVDITYQIYAHRVIPSLIIQDIKVSNPTDKNLMMTANQLGIKEWISAMTHIESITHGNEDHQYIVTSGSVEIPDNPGMVLAVSIVSLKLPSILEIKAQSSTTLHVLTTVNYTSPVSAAQFQVAKKFSEAGALKSLQAAVGGDARTLRSEHSKVWHQLWLSGFGISHSKAENALNGDLINATIYSVLSQASAHFHESHTSPEEKANILKNLAYVEGCYGGPNTLHADRLWSPLSSIEEINVVVNLWMITLEKQGCHKLLLSGTDGIMQAMMLSFGGLQFKNQHLEFNVDPKHLHRDYHFRRLNYGNGTHLNISVEVQEEDYKAIIYCALDRSDRSYYGCDAGCLDPPIQLGPQPLSFPVKLTDPLTAILYITFDKVHMEELKHTIHVKEIALAPAHEHHVIALHKHGHKWGGLPTLFWLTIIALIVIFHLFLFKLVVNEYCGPDIKTRYRKFSDF